MRLTKHKVVDLMPHVNEEPPEDRWSPARGLIAIAICGALQIVLLWAACHAINGGTQ